MFKIMLVEITTLLSLTNSWRAEQGFNAWQINSELTDIAYQRWQEMCADDYFAHTDDQGHDWTIAVKNSPYDYQVIAENLALGQGDAQEVLSAWLASPEHRATVGGDYSEVGIYSGACKIQGREQNLTVEIAAQPAINSTRINNDNSDARVVQNQKLSGMTNFWQKIFNRS